MPKNIADPITKDHELFAFEDELQALDNVIYWHLWKLCRGTGCRIGDVLEMQLTAVDSQGRWIFKPQKQKEKKSDELLAKQTAAMELKAKAEEWGEAKIEREFARIMKPLPTRSVRKTINGEGREILRLRRRLARAGQIYFFESPTKHGSPITRQAVWKYWKLAAANAGITINVATHTARKTAGVRAWKATGGDAAQVSNLLYQKDMQSLSAYLGLTDKAADVLSEKIG